MDSDFLLPWEHEVCKHCFFQNPHAIWLVKYGCFEHFLHKFGEETPLVVVIVHKTMELVRIRPLPDNWSYVEDQFIVCKYKDRCKKGNHCPFPHSKAEQDIWNTKKVIMNGERLFFLLQTDR